MNLSEEIAETSADTEYLDLNVTERCNLRCIYCYQNGGRRKFNDDISFEIATAAIKSHLTRVDRASRLCITFIGGEALLCWPLVRDIMTWTLEKEKEWKREFVLFLDTNGTLLTDEIKTWLAQRRDKVSVGLSLDGTPEAHNLNRSGSYPLIEPHLSFFTENWPSQPVKMTISPQTVPMIFDGIIHIMLQGFLVAANVPMEDIWGSPEEKKIHISNFKKEIEKLVDFFGKNTKIPLPSIIDLPLSTITFEEINDRPWCGSGKKMFAVDPDGKKLPCNRYSRMSFDQSLFDKPLAPITSRCERCMFKPACQTCEANNWETNGNPNDRTTFHCEFTKLQVWGTAQVHTRRIEHRIQQIRSMSESERSKHREELIFMKTYLSKLARIFEQFEHHDLLTVGML